MDRRLFLYITAAAAAGISNRSRGQTPATIDLSERLATIRDQHGFPGIGAAVVRGKTIVAEGVAGVRRVREDAKIAVDDRFAMASCTKKMTAAMIARVVDAGNLSFETTLAEALPGVPMRDDYRGVTVTHFAFAAAVPPIPVKGSDEFWHEFQGGGVNFCFGFCQYCGTIIAFNVAG